MKIHEANAELVRQARLTKWILAILGTVITGANIVDALAAHGIYLLR